MRCVSGVVWVLSFFVKQKTAYEMRISDWSSDVCSSDLDRVVERRSRFRRDVRLIPVEIHDVRPRRAFHDRRRRRRRGGGGGGGGGGGAGAVGRASCRGRVCQYV